MVLGKTIRNNRINQRIGIHMNKANSYEDIPRNSYANETRDPQARDHKLVKEDHNFILAQQSAEQNFKNEQLKIKIGQIGELLGCEDNASRNITALICAILLIILLVLSIIVYLCEKNFNPVMTLWEKTIPIITLALGYLFGKN